MIQAAPPDGPIKIGWARNPMSRLEQLQCGHYERLELIRTIEGGRSAEVWLQWRFSGARLNGEWFRFSPAMLSIALPQLSGGHDVKRHEAVVASVRETKNLAKTATIFGLSRERVRQIVVRHERGHPSEPPLTRNTRKLVPRILWECDTCGKKEQITPSVAAVKGSKCRKCFHTTRVRKTDEWVESWIEGLQKGESLCAVGAKHGYRPHAVHLVSAAVYRRLITTGRSDLISILWPKGLPNYLKAPRPRNRAALALMNGLRPGDNSITVCSC